VVDKEFSQRYSELGTQLRAEQIRIVYRHIKPGIVASAINALLLVAIQWQAVSHFILISWYSLLLLLSFARYALVVSYERARPSAEQAKDWGRYFVYGAAAAGMAWGMAAFLLLPPNHPTQQVITMLVLAGTAAGATATLSALLRAFVVFSLLTLMPLFPHLLYMAGLIHYILAGFTTIFLLFMLASAKRNYDILLTSLRLNFDNQRLLENLEQEKQQAINLNESLKQEIGQRLNAELQLRKKEQNLEEAQRIAGLGSWECDIDRNQVTLSREMKYLLGLDPARESFSYVDFLAPVHEEDRAGVDKARHNALAQASDYLVEYRIPLPGRHERLMEEQGIVRLDDKGHTIGLSAIALDVTQRKEMDRLKRDFISVVSHELRTPLTAITGTLGLIEGGIAGELSEKATELVGVAQRNATRLGKLVNDILDIDKLEFGGLPLELECVDVVAMTRDAIEENAGYADKLGVSLRLGQAPERLDIMGDRDRLIQVMTNLISNAAKYSPSGETVEVRIKPEAEWVRIEVCDHGQGIAESFRDRVFQKFCQGDTSDSRIQYGTGLGLNIAKLIVERHGGEIGFDTLVGQGTSFWFRLPLNESLQVT